ncbi:uncharacterized protein LOC115435834 [Sphaeramia orbicularis]|uniref:uncharacterized protein LOC115435834 n=1 Tax=Sphaeramia orbicularis TaxID=375764 RepID=UPI00117E3630|nr:uncharacterized protein LOC115435834 [Sphaeramia orbicularis]
MDQCEDREEGAPSPKTTDRTPLGPGPDRPLKAQRPGPGSGPGPGPGPGPGLSCVSMNSDDSMGVSETQVEQQSSEVPSDPQQPTQVDSTFEVTQMVALKESLLKILVNLIDGDFKMFKWFLTIEELPIPVSKLENADRMDTVDLMVQVYYTNTQSVTVRVLEKMDRTDLVKKLSKGLPVSKESIDQCRRKLKVKLKRKFLHVFEGIVKEGLPKTLLNQIYTELYITEGGATEVNQDLEDVLKTTDRRQLPKTLTEMYIHFLVVQAKLKNVKYDGRSEEDPHWSPETRKMIESLGKLAFEQLKKGNLIFYESDLTECGIDISSASVYSGVFTAVFREERGLYQDKRFCFIHLSVQEFLAALHVHQTFINSGVNLLSEEQTTSWWSESIFSIYQYIWKLLRHQQTTPQSSGSAETQFYQTAVDQALQSPNGHLDLFLRFLLGLSLQTNQCLLQSLMKPTGSSSETNQKTVEYIKKMISENVSAERSINLFHCLNELEDGSLVDQIQQYLKSGRLSTEQLSPAQWSALAFILLSSEKDPDVFDLKEYSGSEEVLLRLLPVVKASNKAQLSGCNLSERSCEALSSVLRSQYCSLTLLDLSNNDLKDSGVKILSDGLKSPGCRLDTLRLSGCLITEEGCSSLVSALQSNPSHLRQLDLSYNHPGASGQELSALVEDPHWRLDIVRLDPAGVRWLKPGPRKYFCELILDPNTVNEHLKLSENNKKVKRVEEVQSYPDHQDRFDYYPQLISSTGLTGRCYWEVQWSGWVEISVTYRGIKRKGRSDDCVFGGNDQSWSLECNKGEYRVWHKVKYTPLPKASFWESFSSSGTVSVYVDCPAGSVSFYRVSSDKLIHLHTFKTTFTEPLFGGFGLMEKGSTVCVRLTHSPVSVHWPVSTSVLTRLYTDSFKEAQTAAPSGFSVNSLQRLAFTQSSLKWD